MTRLRRLLLAIITSCLVAAAVAGWTAAPTIISPTGVTANHRAIATMQVKVAQSSYSDVLNMADPARFRVVDEISGRGGSGIAGEGALARSEEAESSTADFERALAADTEQHQLEVQQSPEDQYQQTAAVSWFRTILIGGAAVVVSVLGGVAAGGRAAGAAANRLLLGAERAEDLASWMYEMRTAKADMTRRQRWSNRCSLPALWGHTAIRAWTEPLRAFIQNKARI